MNAKRFGGQHSPDAPAGKPEVQARPPSTFRDRKASSVDVRALAMFILPTPLLFAVLGNVGGDIVRAMISLVAYASLMLAAWLLRQGQVAEHAYAAREIARPPAFPRKLVAAVLTGIGVAIAVLLARGIGDILTAVLTAALAVGTHIAAFGLDPMKSKGHDGTTTPDHVIDAIDRAEARITNITNTARNLRDREVEGRVEGLMASVREMLKLVEMDPRDLSRARRYFTVYLKGAEDATRKFADNYARLDDPKLRADYLALIGELEASFGRGREMLLQDERADLEIEIEVLRERLDQEAH